MSTREGVLRDFDTGVNRLLERYVDDLKVRAYDGLAVVTGRSQVRGESKGQKYDVTLHFTDVFVVPNHQW